MAAGGIPYISGIVFIGGSDNPYNYNGIGYNEIPSSPSSDALLYDLESGSWREPQTTATASMDHRGLVEYGDQWITAGGMLHGQQVTDKLLGYTVE
jgi:hypothetical protein